MKDYFDRLAILIIAYGLGFLSGQRHPLPQKIQEPETVTMRVSAYCPCEKCCPGTSDNITANGHRIKPGERFVAADKRFPFGTRVHVPGYNGGRPVPVLDRGGAIKGDRIDVFFDDADGKSGHQRAIEWGVKYLQVEVKKP